MTDRAIRQTINQEFIILDVLIIVQVKHEVFFFFFWSKALFC